MCADTAAARVIGVSTVAMLGYALRLESLPYLHHAFRVASGTYRAPTRVIVVATSAMLNVHSQPIDSRDHRVSSGNDHGSTVSSVHRRPRGSLP